MKKKTLAILSVVVVLVLAVGGILAYLTDTASVTNTFTVGDVNIELDEAKVDENGKKLPSGERTTETDNTNNYKLIPGMRYDKDPTVTVKAGSEKSYVRMIMEIKNADAVDAIIAADDNSANGNKIKDYADLFDGWDNEKWIYETFKKDGDTITFEFRYYEPVDASALNDDIVLEPLFTELVVPGYATSDMLKALYAPETGDPFVMTIYGHAIQAAGFVNDAGEPDVDAAWAAFEEEI